MIIKAQTIARTRGKLHIRNFVPEDLVALKIVSAAVARAPLPWPILSGLLGISRMDVPEDQPVPGTSRAEVHLCIHVVGNA